MGDNHSRLDYARKKRAGDRGEVVLATNQLNRTDAVRTPFDHGDWERENEHTRACVRVRLATVKNVTHSESRSGTRLVPH